MYRERTTGEIKSQLLWRKEFKNTSLPKVWKAATLDALNIDEVLASPQPSVTEMQIAQLDGVIQNSDGAWVENWTVADRFSDIHDENGNVVQTKAEREAEYIANQEAWLASDHRSTRDNLLADSDWTQMNDSPLTNEARTGWATYRAALRSLPEHENWPNLQDADWPTKP